MKDLELPVTQTENVSIPQTSDTCGMDAIVPWHPVTWLGSHLLAGDPAGRHKLVTLSDLYVLDNITFLFFSPEKLCLVMMSPDMGELVSAATVIKVTVCEDNMERLA